MSIESPVGTLDIKNATLRVGKLEVSNIQGIDTALNVTRSNSILLYDDQASATTFNGFTSTSGVRNTASGYLDVAGGHVYWGQKLPNAWTMEFEMDIRSGTNSGPIYANVFSSTNTGGDGYSFTFNDSNDKITLMYDGAVLTETSVPGLFTTSENWQKVVINYERGMITVSLGGSRAFYYNDIEREKPYTTGEYVNVSSSSTDGRKIRGFKVTNGDKWTYSGESNITYTHGSLGIGVVDPTATLDVAGTVNATAFVGDGTLLSNVVNDTDLQSNVTTLRDEMASNTVTLRGDLQSNVTTLRDEMTSNTTTLRGDLQSNVTTLRGEMASNTVTLRGDLQSNVTTLREDLQSNVTILRDEMASNTVTLRGDLQSNVTILRDEMTSNTTTLRGDLQSNVTTLRGEMASNTTTLRGDLQSNVTTLRGEMASNTTTLRGDLQSNVTTLRGEMASNTTTLRGDLQSNVTILRGEMTSNTTTLRGDLQSNVTTLRGEMASNTTTLRGDLQSNVTTLRGEMASNTTTLRGDLQSNVTTLRGEMTSNTTTLRGDLQSNVTTLRGEMASNTTTLRGDLQSNVTILKDTAITFTGIKTFQDDVILESNLRIQGDILVANTINMTVSDPILELGSNNQNTGDLGLVMTRHGSSNSNVAIFFDESADVLKLGYTLNGANDSTLELDSNALAVNIQGALTAASLSGDGSGLTSLNATNIGSGTLDKDRLPTTLNNTTIEDTGSAFLTIHDSSGDNQAAVSYKTTSYTWKAGIHGGDDGKFKISKDDFETNDYLVIDTSGQVGIGTITPQAKLDTRGDAVFDTGKDDTTLTGLLNYSSTQSAIDTGVAQSASTGSISASTDINPPPGVAGDVIAKFVNSHTTEIFTRQFTAPPLSITTGDVIYYGLWVYATLDVAIDIFKFGGTTQGTYFTAIGNSTWTWYEKTITSTSTTSSPEFRIDNNTPGRTYYFTGFTIRKNPSQTTGLPFTPRYSPTLGRGSVLSTQTLVAREATIQTLTGNVGIGVTDPGYKLHVSFDNVNETFIDDGKIVLGRTENISRRLTAENTEGEASDYYLSREHKLVRNANLNYRNTGDNGVRYDTHRIVMGYSNVYEIGDVGYYPTYHALKFQVAPTWDASEDVGEQDTKMIIQGNGNVGIGTTSPSAKLHISSGTSGDCVLKLQADTDNNNEADNPRIEFITDGAYNTAMIGAGQMPFDTSNYNSLVLAALTMRFYTGVQDFTDETGMLERMIINDDGNVGIGTTSPGYKLDVNGTVNTGALTATSGTFSGNLSVIGNQEIRHPTTDNRGYVELRFNNNGPNQGSGAGLLLASDEVASFNPIAIIDTWTSGVSGAPPLVFKTRGTERMRLTDSGDVGIGTDSPGYKLDIHDSTKALMRLKCNASSGDGDAILYIDSSQTGESDIDFMHDGALNWRLRSGDAAGTNFQIHDDDDTARFVIGQDGNVGIGTTSPSAPLHIYSNDNTTTDFKELLRLERYVTDFADQVDERGGYISMYTNDQNSNLGEIARISFRQKGENASTNNENDGEMAFWTKLNDSLSQRMVISPAGDVGIGTTSPGGKLHISNAGAVYTAISDTSAGTDAKNWWTSVSGSQMTHYLSNDANNASQPYMKINRSGYSVSSITFDHGNVGIGTDSPNSKLDVRGTISTGRNLAREVGTVIAYSSQYTSLRAATNVISGIKNFEPGNSDWLTVSGQRVDAYVVVDLGQAYSVDRMVIYNQNEYTNSKREVKGFTLQGSADNSTWTTVLTNECGRSSGHEPNPGWSFRIPASWEDDTEGTSYRYWKFIMNTFHGTDNYGGIMELELYEASDALDDEVSSSSIVAQDVYAETGNFNRGVAIGKGYGGTSTGENNLLVEGNVGIGTTSPGYTLDVDGTVNTGALTATTGAFSGALEVTGTLSTKSDVSLGVMSGHETEGTLKFSRADGTDRVHNIKVYNSSTQASNYMKFQIHAGGASAGALTDNVLYLRGDGNVGIGTTNPNEKLHVEGSIELGPQRSVNLYREDTTGGPSFNIYNTDRTIAGWFGYGSSSKNELRMVSNAQHPLTFWTSTSGAGVEKMRITTDGNVGIGTASPAGKLHLYQSGGGTNMIDKRTNISTADFRQTLNYTHYSSVAQGANRDPDNSRGLWIGNMVDENDGAPSGANFVAFTNSFQFYVVADQTKYDDGLSFTSNSDTLKYSDGNFIKAMHIDSGGNVGIGTTSPSYKLDVHGTSNVGALTATTGTFSGALTATSGTFSGALVINGGPENDTTPALTIGGGLYTTSDLYVLNTYNVNTGVGYAAKVIGVNIKNKVETDNTIQLRNNTGGLTSAGAIYFGSDDNTAGIFGVLGGTGTAGSTLTEHLTVKAGGNVGIGTTSPAAPLDVITSAEGNYIARFKNSSTSGDQDARIIIESSDADGESQLLLQTTNQSTTHKWSIVAGSGITPDLDFQYNSDFNGGTTALSINHGGNVGIGTTGPTSKLHVYGGSAVIENTGTNIVGLYINNNSTPTTGYSYLLNGPRPGTTTSGAVHFINGSARTGDGGVNTYTIRNDSGNLRLGNASYSTILEGTVTHSGLAMSSGKGVDQVTSISKSLTLTTSWQDTGIAGTNLETGSHVVQIYSVSNSAQGGGNYEETYTGVMSWFSGNTNSTEGTEVIMTAAGHAPNNAHIYLQVMRSPTPGNCKLQIRGDGNHSAAYTYVFKFRKLI